jgi:hypothetical protein
VATKPTTQQIMLRARRAEQLAKRGDLTNAALHLLPVIEHARDLHDVVLFWANLRANQGYYAEAAGWYRHVLKSRHTDTGTRQNLALCLRRDGKYDEAIKQLERIRETDQWNVMAVLTMVDTFATQGRTDEALALLTDLEHNVTPEHADDEQRGRMKIIRLRLANDPATVEPALADAQNTALRPDTRASLAQHAGLVLQKHDRHDEAWSAMTLAKDYRGLRFDADEHERRVSKCIDFWSSDDAADLPTSDADGSKYIFIVGMPRSGTSLLEQMLGRIPGVAPMGERSEVLRLAAALWPPARPDLQAMVASGRSLTKENLDKILPMMTQTLAEAAAEFVEGEPVRQIDKQVFNYLHLPLIARVLPGARVLHIRRHPCDTAVSCFSQWFNRKHHFTKDAASLGAYSKQYLRMMDAWSALPSPDRVPEMMEVRYEALAAAPEQTMRPVLDFLGLDWHDDVLTPEQSERIVRTASRDQVRNAINTAAVGRWKPYEEHLRPFIEALGRDAVESYDPAAGS